MIEKIFRAAVWQRGIPTEALAINEGIGFAE